MMTDSQLKRRAWLVPTVSLVVLWGALPSQAQSSRPEFQRQGDVISEKISGFFGRIFGGGKQQHAPTPSYSQAPQGYRQNQAAATQQPIYQQAPVQGRQQAATATPQRQVYRQAPSTATAQRSTTRSSSAVQPKTSVTQRQATKPKPQQGVYTSTKRNKAAETESTSTPSKKSGETVLHAPPPTPFKEESSKTYTVINSSAAKTNSSDLYPLPKKETSPTTTRPSTKESTTLATGSKPSQEFPKGTATSKPGRVVSPYEPHNELDVQGLPSGSLALDPTTQKVFKIP